MLCMEISWSIMRTVSTLLGERKMTQAELARKTGIRPAAINEMYHEFIERINLEHIDKICGVLGCDISDLLQYEPNPSSKDLNS